jgi:acetyltransferase
VCDPDNREAEFALQVASAWQHRGLGRMLLDKLIAYLRARGTVEVVGTCLQENGTMVALAREAGFSIGSAPDGTVRLRLRLATAD